MKEKLTDFANGIASLVISQILIKIFGVIYSIYITNKTGFGDKGNAIYMSGYQIYALLLTVSSIGVPNAIAKLISEKNSQKDFINRERVFKIALFLFAIIGIVGTSFLVLFSNIIAVNILEIKEAELSLISLSPAIFFVSLIAVYKGYFNGINRIDITAKIQFIEQAIKSILTILFVEISSKYSNNNTEIMAASANLATTFSTAISLIYMTKKYIDQNKIYENGHIFPKERILKCIKRILNISIPMTLSVIFSSLGKNIDSLTIVRILKDSIGEELAMKKYGIISSKIDILVTMPLSFNSAISTALIPEISYRKASNDIDELTNKIKFALLITLIIAAPYCFGIFCYSKEIFDILFPNANEGYNLLKLASFGIIFSMLNQTINSILQGLGNNKIPVFSSLIGIGIKFLSNIYLIKIVGIYEKGAIIGNILSSLISFLIVYIVLIKIVDLKIKKNDFLKPFFASLIMIFFSFNFYKFLVNKNFNNVFSSLISISIAVIIYINCVFFMKMIKKEDICKKA